MPGIVRAEYLSYYNSARNSDKLFNVFLIENDEGSYACVTEYGRRGNALVRNTLCANARRETAENKFREKLNSKRYHRDTPYRDEPSGCDYSQVASEYSFNSRAGSVILPPDPESTGDKIEPKSNVITFPVDKTEKQVPKPKQNGILNSDQFDSLEL
jgi:hypothetical protein